MTWCVQRVWHGIGFQLNGVLLTEPLKHFWEVLDDVVLACTLGDSVHSTEQFEGDQSSRLACTSFTTKTLCLAHLCPNRRFGRELSRGIE